MVKITTTNIVGSAEPTTWSQAQSTTITDNKQILIVLQLKCDDKETLIDLAIVGPETLAEIESIAHKVETLDELEELVDKIGQEIGEGLQISVAVGLLKEEKFLIAGKGMVGAYLVREDKIAKLEMGMEGVLKEGDGVIVATTKFVEVVGIPKMRGVMVEDEAPAEIFTPLVHTQSQTSEVAAIVGIVSGKGDVATQQGWLPSFMSRRPKIMLRSEAPRKLNLWVGGGILVLLILMIGVGVVRRSRVVAENDLAELNASVNTKIETVLSESVLNPEQTKMVSNQARGEVEAYLSTGAKDAYKTKARQLLVAIENAEERAFKKNDIKLETVVELTILVEELLSDQMKTDGKGNLVFLDTREPRIVAMNLNDRSRQVIETDTKFVDFGISEAKVYGLDGAGVTELFWKKDEKKKVIEPDEFWKDPTLIDLFAGNVYVLDRGQGEIWKYPTLGDTFGGRRRWFAVGIAPDLSKVIDMKVLGDIWLLTSTGKLERYSRGAPVAFSMEGFPTSVESKKLNDPVGVWVSESYVYVLERGAGRVVVFDMEGKYSQQYINSEFAKASDLVVVDDKAYVLIDNVVKEFGI